MHHRRPPLPKIYRMNRTVIAVAATLAMFLTLPTAAKVKKKQVPRGVPVMASQVLPPASNEQQDAAERIFFGDYVCEFGKSLRVDFNPKFPGYVDLLLDKQLFTLKPVLSHTGALRLEDVRGRLLLVQIPIKSMVLDVKLGQRLVDDCVHETQAENRRLLAAAPPDLGLGLGLGLGINADKTAADAAAQAASAAASAPPSEPAQAAVVPPAPAASAAAAAPPAEQAASAAPAVSAPPAAASAPPVPPAAHGASAAATGSP